MVTISVTPLSTAIGTGASPMEPTSAAPERSASITAAPPLKSANSTAYGASLPALARFHGSDCVAFCSATTSLVPGGTSALLAILTESMAVSASSSDRPQAVMSSEIASTANSFHCKWAKRFMCDPRSGAKGTALQLKFSGDAKLAEQPAPQRCELMGVPRPRLGHVDVGVERDRSVSQHDHPIGQQNRLVDVMGDQQHGGCVATTQVLQQAVHLDARQRIEGAERFVEQQQFGLTHQRPRQRDALSLSPGQRARPYLGLVGEVHFAQCRPSLLPHRGGRGKADGDVGQHALPRQQPRILKDDGPPFRHEDVTLEVAVQRAECPQERSEE